MKAKLLLIEDNVEVLENTAEILELADYQVFTAQNGKTGVKTAIDVHPDLIICDIMMPELDGYGVLHLLSKRADTAQIPFIFLTAKSEGTDFRKGMGMGADDYLTKPFEEIDLLDSIESRLAKRKLFSSDAAKKDTLDDFLTKANQFISLNDLLNHQKKRSYKKKNIIYYDHDEPAHLYHINKGKVKTFLINQDGKEYITGLFNEGDYFGYIPLIGDSQYEDNAEALEEVELTLIPKNDFKTLLFNNKAIASQFIKMLANNISNKEEQLLELAYDTVRKRVARSLLILNEKFNKESEQNYAISISRDDLASMVGTATESVIRMLSEFKEDNYISIIGSKITIKDKKALEQLNH